MTTALLDVQGVSKRYPPGTLALDDVTLQIAAGERVAITGPSGCGKSTLLSILGLLDPPTEGQYRLGGRDVTRLREQECTGLRREAFSFVFQSFHLLDHLSAAENIEYALFHRGISGREAATRAAEALDVVGLSHRSSSLPKTMSGGEQQRVAIARALSARPQVLLCDEPTGSLDSDNAVRVMDLLIDATVGAAVVVITHDADVAARCERQIRMRDGRVLAES